MTFETMLVNTFVLLTLSKKITWPDHRKISRISAQCVYLSITPKKYVLFRFGRMFVSLCTHECMLLRLQPHRSTYSFETLAQHSSWDCLKWFSQFFEKKISRVIALLLYFFQIICKLEDQLRKKTEQVGLKFLLYINQQVQTKNPRKNLP